MIHHITLTGRSIALACDGTVTTQHGAGGATGAVYVEASHLTLLHDMRDGEFYRTGQNSWSPSGWRRLSEAPMRIADEQRRRTADDAPWDDPARHHPPQHLPLPTPHAFPFICAFTTHSLTSHLCSMVIAH